MPNYAEAHFNLGNLLNDTGKQDEAIESFRQAITIEPNFVEAINNLAKQVMDNGDKEEATSLLERVIALDKNHGVAQHLLASLQGKTTSSTPESYVVGLFDGAAGYFDEYLVNELDYKVPEFMEAAVSDLLADKIIRWIF